MSIRNEYRNSYYRMRFTATRLSAHTRETGYTYWRMASNDRQL